MTGDLVAYILGALAVFLGGAWVAEKGKADKARGQRNEAETRIVELETGADVEEISDEHDAARDKSGSAWFDSWRK